MHRSLPTPSNAARRRPLLVAAGLMLAALLAVLPPRLAGVVRAPVAIALLPAQRGLAAVRRAGHDAMAAIRAQFAGVEAAARREAENRRLKQENGRLKAELQAALDQVRLLAQRPSPQPALLAARCVPTRILGLEAQAFLARRYLLDAGRLKGADVGGLVLRTAAPLVDCGANGGVEDGNLVLAGSCVWGKIASTASHTSTVCPITEPGYRDLVRLAAPSGDGAALPLGAKGILEGTGQPLARLRLVETTEPVATGDLVYSMAGQGFVDVPLLCGSVVHMSASGAGHWEIWVAPAISQPPDDLAILCPTVRPTELARRQGGQDPVPRSE